MLVARMLVAILALAVLMVIHEAGHYFAARRYGMRVTAFSIGFGPTLWKYRPKGSATLFRIALIPFLAYVQIAGLNPYEEVAPDDKESYANASLWARIVTIAGGPLANYLFASVLFFFGFVIGGVLEIDETSMKVAVRPGGPAAMAGMVTGDRIVKVDNEAITDWQQLVRVVGSHSGQKIDIEVEREGKTMTLSPTPGTEGESKGKIMVGVPSRVVKVSVGKAALLSITEPPKVVQGVVRGLYRMITGAEKPELSGPVGIVKETASAFEIGPDTALRFLGMLSAYLAAFNLLPFPALDGGRLIFLGFEAASRRRADAKMEAKIHALGLLMFVTLIAFVTYADIFKKH